MGLTSAGLALSAANLLAQGLRGLAKPLVVAAMATLGFLIWRHWVFR